MLVTKLDVVNACLASMGESPVNSLDTDNIFISSALDALGHAGPAELSYGWYFNIEKIELKPTVDGSYYVPTDTIGLTVDLNPPWLSIRARRLYDNRSGQVFTGKSPVQVTITRNLKFEDMPYHAQRAIKAKTVQYFQKSYDGDAQKIQDAEDEYAESRAMLMSEHIRAVGANMLYQGATGHRIGRARFITTARFSGFGSGRY